MTSKNKNILIRIVVFLLGMLLIPGQVIAISEVNYQNHFDEIVRPFMDQGVTFSFQGKGNTTVQFVRYGSISFNGPLVISPGRGESYIQYAELAYDLSAFDFGPIYIIDHRGQGFSDRLLPDYKKGHVEDFYNYVEDFAVFVESVNQDLQRLEVQEQPSLIAHSMGGTIATLHLLHDKGRTFKRAVMISPMYGLSLSPKEYLVVKVVLNVRNLLGRCDDYVKVEDKNKSLLEQIDRPFDSHNYYTSSEDRFVMTKKTLVQENQAINLGKPTNCWVLEAIRATERIGTFRNELRTPTLLLQAEDERRVTTSHQNEFCSFVNRKYCTLEVVTGSRHAIHNERDVIREPVLERINEFFLEENQ